MTTLAVMAFLIAAYAAVSLYVRRASFYLEASSAPWDRMYAAAKEVIADETMPQDAAAYATAAVVCAGCGCVTRALLIQAFTGRLKRRRVFTPPPMTREQRDAVSRVAVNALYYDSLRAPLSGFLLRRLVMPWLKNASERPHPRPKVSVAQIVTSSKEVFSHRKQGKKILAMASLH